MFVEHKEQGEVNATQAKTMKLSEAIRIGCAYVKEHCLFSGCAIGTGYTARTGRSLSRDSADDNRMSAPYLLVGEAFGIPEKIVIRASNYHYRSEKTREQVADWLESQGY